MNQALQLLSAFCSHLYWERKTPHSSHTHPHVPSLSPTLPAPSLLRPVEEPTVKRCFSLQRQS